MAEVRAAQERPGKVTGSVGGPETYGPPHSEVVVPKMSSERERMKVTMTPIRTRGHAVMGSGKSPDGPRRPVEKAASAMEDRRGCSEMEAVVVVRSGCG